MPLVSNKEILKLAIPSIISNITVPLLGLVDLSIVGHIGNERYISAIAVGSMMFNVMYWLLGFLRMGTSGLTSQAYGKQDRAAYIDVLLRTLALGLGIGLLFVVLQRPLESVLMALMDTPAESRELVRIYFEIVVFGAPAMLGLYGVTGWFIGMQDTKTPMFIAIFQNIVNILASLSFVYGCGLSISGVALGTLLAQWSGFIAALLMAYRKLLKTKHKTNNDSIDSAKESSTESIRKFWQRFFQASSKRRAWKSYFVLNRDIFLRTLCIVAVNLFFTKAGGSQGAMILAVNTLLMTLFTLFSYFMDGFAYAGEALSGRFYGAGEPMKLRSLVKRLFVFGLIVSAVFTILYAWGGTDFLRLLTNDEQVVRAARAYLPWACIIPLAGMTAFVMDGVFIGLTETRGMLMSGFVAAGIFFAVYYLFGAASSNDSLWMAFLLFLFMRGLVSMIWAKRLPERLF